MEQVVLKIEGMSCNVCSKRVERALEGIAGVTSVSVDLKKKEAVVTSLDTPAELAKVVEELGFKVIDQLKIQ